MSEPAEEREESLIESFNELSGWGKAGVVALGAGALGVVGAFLAIAGNKKPAQNEANENTPAAVSEHHLYTFREIPYSQEELDQLDDEHEFDEKEVYKDLEVQVNGEHVAYLLGDDVDPSQDPRERVAELEEAKRALESTINSFDLRLQNSFDQETMQLLLATIGEPDQPYEQRTRIETNELAQTLREYGIQIQRTGSRTMEDFRERVLFPELNRYQIGKAYKIDATARTIEVNLGRGEHVTFRYDCDVERIEQAIAWEGISAQPDQLARSLREYALSVHRRSANTNGDRERPSIEGLTINHADITHIEGRIRILTDAEANMNEEEYTQYNRHIALMEQLGQNIRR